ncbi:MAG: ornithine carbamoyltransferase [Planctomycetaceae bacterium]|nr:ornithine carbamoyltransferase [Planctomycetota bacterium]NUN52010.1 ornithine carbamoyltransferase [Planctomycetaceae bacterium]
MMHLLSLSDWTREQVEDAVRLAALLKAGPAGYASALRGRILLMMFEKPSLRTRLSFEAAMLQTGGHAIHYDVGGSPLGKGKETLADTARTASRFVGAIMARLYRQSDLVEIARHATVPVINGLTDVEHPCQALGDLLTLRERRGHLAGLKVAFLGDGNNNVTHSLMDACSKTGVNFALACPESREYLPLPEVAERTRRAAAASGARMEVVHDPVEAAAGADAIYTDTWVSYHHGADQKAERTRMLEPFRVTAGVMARAKPDAVFLHCLPAERGAEVAAEVIDGPRSIVFDQAENRLHAQKAVLLRLLNPQYHPQRTPL